MELTDFYKTLDGIFQNGDLGEAETYVLRELNKAQGTGDVAGILAASNELGGIYRVTSRFEEGKNAYKAALGAVKLLHLENTEQHGTALLNLATVYAASKNGGEALKLYDEAAEIFKSAGLGHDYRIAALYNNISHVYEEAQDYVKAEESARKALDIICGIAGSQAEQATTYTAIANICIKQGRYEEAEKHLHIAESIFAEVNGGKDVHYGATLNVLGELHYRLKNYELSEEYFKRALDVVRTGYGTKNVSYGTICKNLAALYDAMGRIGDRMKYENEAAEAVKEVRHI